MLPAGCTFNRTAPFGLLAADGATAALESPIFSDAALPSPLDSSDGARGAVAVAGARATLASPAFFGGSAPDIEVRDAPARAYAAAPPVLRCVTVEGAGLLLPIGDAPDVFLEASDARFAALRQARPQHEHCPDFRPCTPPEKTRMVGIPGASPIESHRLSS